MVNIIKEFITKEEEQFLLSNLKPSRVVSGLGRNRIYRYGSDTPYKGVKSKKIPEWLDDVCRKVGDIDHITINEYHKGQGIDWHIDSKGSGQIIKVLSLESGAILGVKDEEVELKYLLPTRSLLQMDGDDRWNKKHCIYPVDSHRWSIVFRKGTNE